MAHSIAKESKSKFNIEKPNRTTKAFWTLNGELNPANKVTFERLIDATEMDLFRSQSAQGDGHKPSYTALVVKAASVALKEFPYANRALIGFPFAKKLVQFKNMDITVAIEKHVEGAEEHLVLADTIYEVDDKSVSEITKELQNFSATDFESSQRGKLFHDILSKLPVFISKWIIRMPSFLPSLWVKHRGNACMVNSPAKYGIDLIVVDQIWPLTVSFGWIKDRALVIKGEVEARKTMPLIIFFDRRIMAGAPAAKFFNRLAEILENATKELK